MASIAIPLIIGAAVSAASAGLQYLFAKKQKRPIIERNRNDDLLVTTPGLGTAINWGYGKRRVEGVIVFSGYVENGIAKTGVREIVTETQERVSGGGGKGGGGSNTQTVKDYSYRSTLRINWGEGVADVTKIWADDKEIYSYTPDNNSFYYEAEDGTLAGNASVAADAECSSGEKVTGIGGTGKLTLALGSPTPPSELVSNTETIITVYYKSDSTRVMDIIADGLSAGEYSFPATDTVGTKVIRIAGLVSTVEFSDTDASNGACPEIDRISAYFSYTNIFPPRFPITGVRDPYIDYPIDPFTPFPYYNYRPPANAGTGTQSFNSLNTANIRNYDGSETQLTDAAEVAWLDARFGSGNGQDYATAYRGEVSTVLDDYKMPNSRLPNFTAEIDDGIRDLDEIVTDLYAKKGISSADLDLTALAGLTIEGITIPDIKTPASVINDLETWFRFQMVSQDGKLKAFRLDSESIATIDHTELRAFTDDEQMPEADVEITPAASEDALPEAVHISFLNPAKKYEKDTARSNLFASTEAQEVVNLSFPFSATLEEAQTVANNYIIDKHIRNRVYKFDALPKHSKYTVGDVLTVDCEYIAHKMQIFKKELDATGKVRFYGFSAGQLQSIDNATSQANTPGTPTPPHHPSNSALFAFESEPVLLGHNELGVYVAACSLGTGSWRGAGIYNKFPNEEYQLLTIAENAAQIGTAQATLGSHTDADTEDTTNSLLIYFYEDIELESKTASELADRKTANLIRIGDEWVQFRTAAAYSLPASSMYKSAWTISNFQRGRIGTVLEMASHGSDEPCVVWTDAVKFVTLDSKYYEQEVSFKAVTSGQDIDTAQADSFIILGLSLQGQQILVPAPDIAQASDATNTEVVLQIENFPIRTTHRQVRYSQSSTFASGIETISYQSANLANNIFSNAQTVVTTSESTAVTKYMQVRHSIGGQIWGDWSDTLAVDFSASGGGSTPPANSPPTFTSASYAGSGVIDLVFAKNGTATGNIEVEYKLSTDTTWTTHATTFAHSATSGSVTITASVDDKNYNLRLRQVGVNGTSATEHTVTVTGTGGSSSDPPTNLVVLVIDDDEAGLSWTAGTGGTNYTVEYKENSSALWTTATESESTTSYDLTIPSPPQSKTLYNFRVSQNGVTGYATKNAFLGGGGLGE